MSKFSKFLLAPVTCSNFAPRHSNRFGPPAECSKSDFGHFWAILALFGRSWAKIWDITRKDTLPTVPKPQPGCPVTRSMPFQPFGTTRVLKVRFWPFYAIFGHFWTILALFGGSWTKIGETLALPTGSKLQPGCPVTCSMPFQPFWITRVLKQER